LASGCGPEGKQAVIDSGAEDKIICILDYLTGTLATAYKGRITSLVLKDFCMLERDAYTIFKGTVLSLPEGNYRASLLHEGIELARTGIREGFFELKAESIRVAQAKNLQIDIIQNGRHIGTFLLKRETNDGFFVSALELSEETRDINFGLLTHQLQGKIGLAKKAEDIIAAILSTKQNWKKFSEQINSFSKDLFWFDRRAYTAWYEILVRWSLYAAERVGSIDRNKAVSNVLSLVELPIENEPDREQLRPLVNAWLNRINGSSIDFSACFILSVKAFSSIHEAFPEEDLRPALHKFVNSLRGLLKSVPALHDDILERIKDLVSADDFIMLSIYSEKRRDALLDTLSGVSGSLDKREYARVFTTIFSADVWLLQDRDMITVFYDVIGRNLTKESAGTFTGALMQLSFIFNSLPDDIYKTATKSTIGLIETLLKLERTGICETLLSHIAELDDPFKTDIILNPATASAVLGPNTEKSRELYMDILDEIIIPPPNITGFSHDTWAEMADPLHLERLSKFLAILRLESIPLTRILVRVICNIYTCGVFIPDDKIFQREISKYLNSCKTGENFLLHYILLKKLPVYYHEVGATGRLRDDTTEIDSWGNDTVLYFLRKQVHANASNYLVHMIEEIIKSWVYSNTKILKGAVPEELIKTMDTRLLKRYSRAIRPVFESSGILDANGLNFNQLLSTGGNEIMHKLNKTADSDEIRSKILLICRIYSELTKKYSLVSTETPEEESVSRIINSVRKLKGLKDIIVSPEKTLPEESLYFKRHIAFGIPSVMGSYHEAKFDALAEALKIEERLRIFVEGLTDRIKKMGDGFTETDVREWIQCICALNELMQWHGIQNFQMDELTVILKENNLYLSQIIDLLRICQKEMSWIVDTLTGTFHTPLVHFLEKIPPDELPVSLRRLDAKKESFVSKAVDVLMRAVMGSIAGFFELDRFINIVIETLGLRLKSGSDQLLDLSGKSDTVPEYVAIAKLSDADAMRLSPQIGSKAKNLVYLHNAGLLVPQGAVFPANRTQGYENYIESSGFQNILRTAVREIEERTGALFGGRSKPLFLSVRSGSYISMPGILSSILYCGMNQETIEAFIEDTHNPWLAWDSCRRFIEHYGTIVYGLDISIFETITDDFLKSHHVTKKEELIADQMKEITSLYHRRLEAMNRTIPDDVYEQLKESVKAIFRSWYSERSVQFRKAMAISDHWGTSVTIMQMICGNDRDSGASVFFTRKPFSFEKGIYGDTKETATGSELVYGRSVNRPLARQQALNNQKSLEETDPPLFQMHAELSEKIEQAMRGLPQEVEATYTRGSYGKKVIYLLQTKRMEFHRGFTKRFDDVCNMEAQIIGRGVGVYGGALSGIVTFALSPDTVRELRTKMRLPIILLRREASTDDVSLMPEINGLITAAGGATSHAAILAQKFHLTAIVGCSDMAIETDDNNNLSAHIGPVTVREGDPISIDGSTGLLYSGLCFSPEQTVNIPPP
jgi:pyruvate, orthophosphate dikinase